MSWHKDIFLPTDDGLAPTMIDVEYKFRRYCESERNQCLLQGCHMLLLTSGANLLHFAIQAIVVPNVC